MSLRAAHIPQCLLDEIPQSPWGLLSCSLVWTLLPPQNPEGHLPWSRPRLPGTEKCFQWFAQVQISAHGSHTGRTALLQVLSTLYTWHRVLGNPEPWCATETYGSWWIFRSTFPTTPACHRRYWRPTSKSSHSRSTPGRCAAWNSRCRRACRPAAEDSPRCILLSSQTLLGSPLQSAAAFSRWVGTPDPRASVSGNGSPAASRSLATPKPASLAAF